MTRDEMFADLAYARTLAEEGRHAPLIGGRYLILFGLLLSVTYVAHWAILTGAVDAPRWMLGAIWAGFGVCAGIGSALVGARVRALPGQASLDNRIDRAVWSAVTLASAAVIAGCLIGAGLNRDPQMPNAIMPAVFGFYGIALMTTASVASKPWLRWFAFAAFGVSGLVWLCINADWTYLVGAAAALLVLLAPGIIMVRAEPSTTV